MKILVIGGGGREHALAWRLSQSPSVTAVYVAPGNPGAARVATCIPASTPEDWLRFASETRIDLTVVGPEAPLVAGVVDRFRHSGLAIVGPTAAAAQIEGSKTFAKQLMSRANVPTARFRSSPNPEAARAAVEEFGFPVVLKTDGLAAGKGVVIAQDLPEAEQALSTFPAAPVLVEEFLEGEEVSFIVISDGERALPFAPTQDHKRAYDGDQGPNTGGMGAYRDSRILLREQQTEIMRAVINPVLAQMASEGNPFTGFLYAGLMMTRSGPKVLEFNARLGDPETQALMHSMRSDLAEVLSSAAHGDLSGVPAFEWSPGSSVCVVLAARGYPVAAQTGDVISGIDTAEELGATAFHAGTRQGATKLETSGGRVLGVTASAENLPAAIESAYAAVRAIRFEGMHYRSDIGARGVRR